MSTVERAFLYVTRKKGKSILLFFVLLIMATFVLSGLSVGKTAQSEQKKLRQTMGGTFELSPEFSEKNPYFKVINDGEGGMTLYTERPLTQEMIDLILKTDGIKSCDADTQSNVQANIEIFEGNVALKGEINDSVYARTVYSSETNSFFTSQRLQLIEGRHITNAEKYSAVISKELADKNGLKIGDSFSIKADFEVKVNIIGFYKILAPDSAFENIATYEKIENQIFVDYYTLQKLFKDTPVGFLSAKFSVDDPADLEKITKEVKENSEIDWQAFTLTTDNKEYQQAAAPLEKLQFLVTSIILVIALVSGIILALILTMWGRSRVHETGVLLSIGIYKSKIIGQYLVEVLMIAIIAFGISFFTSNAVANQLANGLIESPSSEENSSTDNNVVWNIKDDYGLDLDDVDIIIADEIEETEKIHVSVDIYDMFRLYLIGFAIIMFSVLVSSGTVMRLKPREILSKMS
ncbi:MAG: FtsX-like permease family protein [Clostridiales bacterium]|nr:FtsX-like permease family protein [Clostridiales bacterium]